MRKLTKIIFFLLLCINAHASDIWSKEREKAKSMITQDKLAREISFLTDSICQGRASGTKGSVEAAMWIQRKFEEARLISMSGSWSHGFVVRDSLAGRNVVGMLAGSKSIPCDRYVIVGAHYDHIGILDGKLYPGADANASGVTAMTSLAEMFSAMRKMGRIYTSNIIFVAFDAKQYDFKGSESLWNMIEEGQLRNPVSGELITSDKIALMVNIDQIGSSLSPIRDERKDYVIMLGTSSLEKSKRNFLTECNAETGIGMDIALDYYGSQNFTDVFYRLSDQRVFVDNRKPAVLFTSGITMNNNKTWDRTENLDLEVYHKRISLMYHWIEKML